MTIKKKIDFAENRYSKNVTVFFSNFHRFFHCNILFKKNTKREPSTFNLLSKATIDVKDQTLFLVEILYTDRKTKKRHIIGKLIDSSLHSESKMSGRRKLYIIFDFPHKNTVS